MANQSGSLSRQVSIQLNLEEGSEVALTKDAMARADASTIPKDGHFHQIVMEDTKQIEDASDLKNHLENLTKVPTPNILEYQAGHSTKTKFDALNARNLATLRKTV